MKSFKLHIARLLCLVIIFLISSNVAYSVEVYRLHSTGKIINANEQLKNQSGQLIADDESSQVFNLVKDPQEIDFDLFIEECSFVAIIINAFLFIEKKTYFSYKTPLLNHAPIWIRNLQIRL